MLMLLHKPKVQRTNANSLNTRPADAYELEHELTFG